MVLPKAQVVQRDNYKGKSPSRERLTNQAGLRDAGGSTCLRKKNLLKILTAFEIVRQYGL